MQLIAFRLPKLDYSNWIIQMSRLIGFSTAQFCAMWSLMTEGHDSQLKMHIKLSGQYHPLTHSTSQIESRPVKISEKLAPSRFFENENLHANPGDMGSCVKTLHLSSKQLHVHRFVSGSAKMIHQEHLAWNERNNH